MGVKITEAMVKAGEKALIELCEDEAMRRGDPMPDFEGMSDENKEGMRRSVLAVLTAGANAYLKGV